MAIDLPEVAATGSNTTNCADDLHLWLLDDQEITSAQVDQASSILSAQEIARADGFRFARDRRLFLIARAFLRIVLSKHAPRAPDTWRFQYTAFGRPEIASGLSDFPLYFNLSHTYGLIAVAISSTRDVGVDAERLDRIGNFRSMRHSALTRREDEELNSLAEPLYNECFLRLWTLKEAYAKARGLGLSLGFDRFGFIIEDDGVQAFGEDAELSEDLATAWQFVTLRPTTSHLLSYAIRRGSGSTQIRWPAFSWR